LKKDWSENVKHITKAYLFLRKIIPRKGFLTLAYPGACPPWDPIWVYGRLTLRGELTMVMARTWDYSMDWENG
jgi:hypothetical protein